MTTYRSDHPTCPVPQNDKERIIKMHDSLDSIYLPEFEMPELKEFAAKFREGITLLRDEIKKESYKHWRRKET